MSRTLYWAAAKALSAASTTLLSALLARRFFIHRSNSGGEKLRDLLSVLIGNMADKALFSSTESPFADHLVQVWANERETLTSLCRFRLLPESVSRTGEVGGRRDGVLRLGVEGSRSRSRRSLERLDRRLGLRERDLERLVVPSRDERRRRSRSFRFSRCHSRTGDRESLELERKELARERDRLERSSLFRVASEFSRSETIVKVRTGKLVHLLSARAKKRLRRPGWGRKLVYFE